MMHLSNKRMLLSGFVIILLTNAIVLGGVAYNRSGDPTSSPTLTERELALPYAYGFEKENSAISLRLRWRVFDSKKARAYYSSWEPAEWLDADKLAALGFDVSYPLDQPGSDERYRKLISREVLLVMENDGPEYQKSLQQRLDNYAEAKRLRKENPDTKEFEKRLKNASAELAAEKNDHTRLFMVDAGLNYESLRQQYSDTSRYLIVKGQVRLGYYKYKGKPTYLRGSIQGLSIKKINIPLQHARLLLPLMERANRKRGEKHARYSIDLHYGQRYEPWVMAVKEL
jgi:hypothetical protein